MAGWSRFPEQPLAPPWGQACSSACPHGAGHAHRWWRGAGGVAMIADCAVYRAGERRPGSLRLEQAAAASQQADSFVWLALHEPTPYELTTTRAQFGLDALAVADTPQQHKRAAMQIHGEGLFAVLQNAPYIETQEAGPLGQIGLFGRP